MKPVVSFFILFLSSTFALAQQSPAGTWRTIDDETGKPKSIIEIVDNGGTFEGKVVELINPSTPNPVCDKCKGDRAGQPVTGMTIVWGVTQKKENKWGGGKILDPKKGKEYKVNMSLQDGGSSLKVRGFIGAPMLGRTQVWERITN